MRRNPRWAPVLAIGLIASLLVAPQVLAQNPTGTLIGKVLDVQGNYLPGVTVTATSPNLQGARTAITGVNGDYKFAFLPAGTYEVTYELEGFPSAVREVRMSAAQTQISDIQMQDPTVVEETIVVTSALETISETSSAASTYSQDEVEKLPVARTVLNASLLTPGVADTGPRGSTSTQGNVTIAGAMSFENLWLVNGVVINENLRGQALDLYIEDAVQETTTTVSGVSAEYGRFTGGVVNALTKSGGNEFSGSLRSQPHQRQVEVQDPAVR